MALLLIMIVVGIYVALAKAAVENHGELLDSITDGAGVYGVVCLLVATGGLCLMVGNIALCRNVRWSALLLVVAFCYAAGNVCVLGATLVADAFAIFSRPYMVFAVFVGPAMMTVAVLIVTGFYKRLAWLGVVGFVTWICCVGFAHLWIIAAASASV